MIMALPVLWVITMVPLDGVVTFQSLGESARADPTARTGRPNAQNTQKKRPRGRLIIA
jgi:hypothetical protein